MENNELEKCFGRGLLPLSRTQSHFEWARKRLSFDLKKHRLCGIWAAYKCK